MKKLLLLAFLPSLVSCFSAKIIPVQGSYPATPMTFSSEKSTDQVWDKLIDLFAQNGLSIKLIDKSSGLIISDNSAITATWEGKGGVLYHPDANIVVPKYLNSNLQMQVGITYPYPDRKIIKKADIVHGEWNVRIKKAETGTLINVNLVNVQYETPTLKGGTQLKTLTTYKSTGRFEKMIADFIK